MASKRSFTLIELMIVFAIVAILFAIIGEALAGAKAEAKKASCAFNMRQMGIGIQQYLVDFEDVYPQTKLHGTPRPDIDDADGSLDQPDRGHMLVLLGPAASGVADCPSDPGVDYTNCSTDVNSYLINAYFVFGVSGSGIPAPASTIFMTERRSMMVNGVPEYCDDTYHPWFNPTNPLAPRNDMDEKVGAIATERHVKGANYQFADDHAHWYVWGETYSPQGGINHHTIWQ